jgi:ABC-type lipoprotein export system ATPase subunit
MPIHPSESIDTPLAFVEQLTPAGACRIPIRSARAAEVAHCFGLDSPPRPTRSKPRRVAPALDPWPDLALAPGTITFLTGASGSGKTSLLRWTRQRFADSNTPAHRTWIDLAALPLPQVPLVDCFDDDLPLEQILAALSRVGLGEAWSYLRTPAELSEGQRWRLRLALGLHRAAAPEVHCPVIVADEFCALLDRVTAYIVARCLRKAIDANPRLAALLAASQDDLLPALRPERIIHCDFGRTTNAAPRKYPSRAWVPTPRRSSTGSRASH